ncbi:MAG TPA: hypothetical protein VJ812_08410 [Gemmatimonadaceae bacterium]|nr:hypothetical protein [Gemmatimonadaceae bacterium]
MTRTSVVRRLGIELLRGGELRAAAALLVGLLALTTAPAARAQVVAGGDFDICDNCGTLEGNTARLSGRSSFGTSRGVLVLINAATVEQDVDHDGFAPGINFNNLAVTDTTDFVNIANPAAVILRTNLVIQDFLNPLNNGFQNQVAFFVNIPAGTAAGVYRGQFEISDTVAGVALNPNGEALRVDGVFVEVTVLPERGIGLVQADTTARADSLVLRGRSGQTVSGVVRVANLGNVTISDVRFDATDLVATSGTGLRIPKERISFSPGLLTALSLGDTARITVNVRIPTGLLAGPYRGALLVQGGDVGAVSIPLTVVVTTAGDIVFETNPVSGRAGDLGVIIFNADPGTNWRLRIFDMMGIASFAANGTVFAGGGGNGGGGGGPFPGDQAVRFTWPLVNGRGEPVAGGMYYVVVEAIQDGERRQMRSKLMVIR